MEVGCDRLAERVRPPCLMRRTVIHGICNMAGSCLARFAGTACIVDLWVSLTRSGVRPSSLLDIVNVPAARRQAES
jgi:hypothetical protein